MPYYCPFFNNNTINSDLLIWNLPTSSVIDMWDQLDHMDWLDQFAPLEKDCILKTKEVPDHMYSQTVTTLCAYPQHARAVHTKVTFEESRAINGRLFSKLKLRKNDVNHKEQLEKMTRAYFRKDWKNIVSGYQSNLINYNANATQEWIENAKMPDEKLK